MTGEKLIPIVIFCSAPASCEGSSAVSSYYAILISFLHSDNGEMLPSDEDNEVAAVSGRLAVASLYKPCLSDVS